MIMPLISLEKPATSPGFQSISLCGIALFIFTLGAISTYAQEIPTVDAPPILYFPNANSRPTYFTIHNVHEAWAISKGEGVKVGILDHSFGYDVHKDLYAGGRNFQKGDWGKSFNKESHHGFWMF